MAGWNLCMECFSCHNVLFSWSGCSPLQAALDVKVLYSPFVTQTLRRASSLFGSWTFQLSGWQSHESRGEISGDANCDRSHAGPLAPLVGRKSKNPGSLRISSNTAPNPCRPLPEATQRHGHRAGREWFSVQREAYCMHLTHLFLIVNTKLMAHSNGLHWTGPVWSIMLGLVSLAVR